MYSTKEAAEYLGVKVFSVYYYVRRGRLTPDEMTPIYLFSEDNLREFKTTLPDRRLPPQTGPVYETEQALDVLGIKRDWLYTLAKQGGWRVGRGLFDKAKVDQRAAHMAQRRKK